MSITAGIRSRELCQAPISASVILSLTGVVGESISFSNLQMQRRLRPDSNARLEVTYRHSLIHLRARSDHGHRGRLGMDLSLVLLLKKIELVGLLVRLLVGLLIGTL